MLKYVLFSVFGPFTLVELLLYRQYTALVLGSLYLALSWQANWAAERWRKQAREPGRAASSEPPAPTVLEVAPLGRRAGATKTASEVRPEASRPPPATPFFGGRAHQVLGVPESCRTRTIQHAFRHWVMRYHPDRSQGLPANLANDRVQKLTDARDELLERRRTRGAA